jgi:branched-subunit amino acid transport protein
MSTSAAIVLVLGASVITALIKAAGPVALGGRDLPERFNGYIALLAPALFTALIVTQVLADGDELGVGADTAGLAVAGVALWRGASMVAGVLIAAATTALLRLVF